MVRRESPSARPSRMVHLLQIDHCGVGVEFLAHVVGAWILDLASDRPLLTRGVAEHNRARRAGLGTRSRELVTLHRPAFRGGAVFGVADALHAERALLLDALATPRELGVELTVKRVRVCDMPALGV